MSNESNFRTLMMNHRTFYLGASEDLLNHWFTKIKLDKEF